MTVNLLGFCLNQNFGLVGRHDVVIERLQGEVSCSLHIEYGTYFFAGLERVLYDFLSVSADLGVVFPVLRWLDTIDAFGAESTSGYVLKGHLLSVA